MKCTIIYHFLLCIYIAMCQIWSWDSNGCLFTFPRLRFIWRQIETSKQTSRGTFPVALSAFERQKVKKLPPENIFNVRIAGTFRCLPPLGFYFIKSRRKLFPVVAALCRKVQKFKKISRNFRRRKPLYQGLGINSKKPISWIGSCIVMNSKLYYFDVRSLLSL